jgi:hypothetical protein
MGKASSSKKIARAAKAGANVRAVRERPKLAYPLGIFAILVIGTLLVVYARGERTAATDVGSEPPTVGQNWQQAYGVDVCGTFAPALTSQSGAANGVSTNGDGIINVQPQNGKQAGANARLSLFADSVGMKLGSDSITMPDGTEYKNGYDCGGKPAKVTVTRWGNVLDPASVGQVFDKNFGDIRFNSDDSAFTFAVVPEGTVVPMPDSTNTMITATVSEQQSAAAGTGASGGLPTGAGGLPTGAGGLTTGGAGAVPTVPVAPTDAPVTPGAESTPGSAP